MAPAHFTWRSAAVGVLIGLLMAFSNTYFGLQSGWVTMASLPSTLIGFGVFRALPQYLPDLTVHEHVLLQTVAVSCATLPLAAGFVGILPALSMLTVSETGHGPRTLSVGEQFLWAASLAFFGVFFASPLRTQTILREKLTFPSGTATAKMISVLHSSPAPTSNSMSLDSLSPKSSPSSTSTSTSTSSSPSSTTSSSSPASVHSRWLALFASFTVSSLTKLLTYFVPPLERLKVFTWVSLQQPTDWFWSIRTSWSYVGQGMIMGLRTTLSMLLGALAGWAVLGPIARHHNYAPGPIGSDKDGAAGWILWISLSLMLSESLVSLAIFFAKMLYKSRQRGQRHELGHQLLPSSPDSDADSDEEDTTPTSHLVPRRWWVSGLAVSCVFCAISLQFMFDMPFYEPVVALLLSFPTAVVAVRALGETDMNPVSGTGKLAQVVFAAVAPGNVVASLVAGAVAEAGAQQAGDLCQTLKTAHLLRASPRAQFLGQLIGSFFSIIFSVAAYQLFTSVYEVPSAEFEAPTARIWVDMAALLNGGSVAPHVVPYAIAAAVLGAALACCEQFLPEHINNRLPSGVAMAIGVYVKPEWTLPRLIGAVAQHVWLKRNPDSHSRLMIVVASGLVLGEGTTSILTAIFTAAHVPKWA